MSSVNTYFEELIQDTVNLDSEETDRIRNSRDRLVSQIVNLVNQGKTTII